ncbi:hypothetical protein [Lysobacter sp. ESA13C]|uniref:hypothetical protein n=1 Tax=Lysobacter sp. ESA13C TaxID=2862676 RepID=UPI001CBFEEE4|nr:hypothetical protein [Lysobacter sp. ESA13C]
MAAERVQSRGNADAGRCRCRCLEDFAVVVAVRRLALAKATEDPEGGAQGCAPFFIGTRMSRMKNPRVGTARAGLWFKAKAFFFGDF